MCTCDFVCCNDICAPTVLHTHAESTHSVTRISTHSHKQIHTLECKVFVEQPASIESQQNRTVSAFTVTRARLVSGSSFGSRTHTFTHMCSPHLVCARMRRARHSHNANNNDRPRAPRNPQQHTHTHSPTNRNSTFARLVCGGCCASTVSSETHCAHSPSRCRLASSLYVCVCVRSYAHNVMATTTTTERNT